MNPFYLAVIVGTTLSGLVVKAYDNGKTNTPPANVVASMLTAGSTATIAAAVVANAINGALYDTMLGRTPAGDAK
jgi:hypothetical protein